MSVLAFEHACEKVSKLAARFQANEGRYLSPNYQEAEVRKDFIDKFFIALGWDVNHDEQTNPYEQEVKVEPTVSAGGQRRADYAFHLAPNYRDVRFFAEAKKPHGDIATTDNYFQTIRYGWNTETPLAVLTDFKQFHVLDCRYKPDIATTLHRHIAKYHYNEYFDQVTLRFSSADSAISAPTSLDRTSGCSKHAASLTFLWVGARFMIVRRSSRFAMPSLQSNGPMMN
ncbi:MAG: hypothetical protein M3178_15690 [Pseudomonadota bacterium]|nr:hypothetical protein [Pseudomonadota bacterium]